MNILTFVGKVGNIKYTEFFEFNESKYIQISFYEKYENKLNYLKCYLPKRIFDDNEDFVIKGTILEVLAHIESNIIIKNGIQEIDQIFIIDKINFLELNEDFEDFEFKSTDTFDLKDQNIGDDIPF